ncbi:ATP-binding protein [Methanolobus bombayensis]|uniref:ATP-binding protein n=1 Tax=Methanolobus bombayensis TaxID=38023 RepID=UPI001AE6E6FD|nr:ATP-binding protein [Methanolobus bombayensis]MBP1910114.1 putative AAA+ superfamily ATPase [Methanolobus bombayensis]
MEQLIEDVLEKQNPWWFGKTYSTGIPRLQYYPRLSKYLNTEEILLILGARRTGKSTLIYQLIRSLELPEDEMESVLYMNLDEPVFQSQAERADLLSGIIEDHIAATKKERYFIFLDEVQNFKYWTQTLKTLYDTDKRLKFILTGSTSSLLEKKTITRLSGRYLALTVYPLTFREQLDFKGLKRPTSAEKRLEFEEYLRHGSFPRISLEEDTDIKEELLKNYYETIYLKDIIFPHKLRNNRDVINLLYFIISNVGKPFSYNSMANALEISADTVKEYLGYAEDSYLLYSINKFDYSLRKQLANPKKIYCLDTGMINAVSFRFSENYGRLLENLVFIELVRRQSEVYYHKGTYECDFLIKTKQRITGAIQVTKELNPDNRKRELEGLLEAMKAHDLQEGLILTRDISDMIEIDGRKILIKPVWKWLLEEETSSL